MLPTRGLLIMTIQSKALVLSYLYKATRSEDLSEQYNSILFIEKSIKEFKADCQKELILQGLAELRAEGYSKAPSKMLLTKVFGKAYTDLFSHGFRNMFRML